MKNSIIIPFLLLSISAFNQTDDSLLIKGITTNTGIIEEYKRLDYVNINVYEYNSILTTYKSGNVGKFEFKIPINSYITIEFEKDGFISKRILFDTRLSPDLKKINPFNLEIVMLDYVKEIDTSELDFPITLVQFNEEAQDFIFVNQYTEEMLDMQNGVLREMAD